MTITVNSMAELLGFSVVLGFGFYIGMWWASNFIATTKWFSERIADGILWIIKRRAARNAK